MLMGAVMVTCSQCSAWATVAHICPDGQAHLFCERHSRAYILEMLVRGYDRPRWISRPTAMSGAY